MDIFKKFIDDLAIDAFEADIKIAGLAVISESGNLIYQTKNWDISNQVKSIISVTKGDKSIVFNGVNFFVAKTIDNGIIATGEGGMGYVLIITFQGGVLVSYAMPQADPSRALMFLKQYALRLNGKI